MLMAKTKDKPNRKTSLFAVVTVDDPYSQPGQVDKLQGVASLRDDPLRRLHVRGHIDDAQYFAGRHWQRLNEQSQIGALKAMDTTYEPVDGGRLIVDPLTDTQRRAVLELMRLDRVLGLEGARLIREVLSERRRLCDTVAAGAFPGEEGARYAGKRLAESLATLAIALGYAMQDRRGRA